MGRKRNAKSGKHERQEKRTAPARPARLGDLNSPDCTYKTASRNSDLTAVACRPSSCNFYSPRAIFSSIVNSVSRHSPRLPFTSATRVSISRPTLSLCPSASRASDERDCVHSKFAPHIPPSFPCHISLRFPSATPRII